MTQRTLVNSNEIMMIRNQLENRNYDNNEKLKSITLGFEVKTNEQLERQKISEEKYKDKGTKSRPKIVPSLSSLECN